MISRVLLAALALPAFVWAGACTHLNECSGHGVCDEKTRTCLCYDGWGSENDIATYRAADCSQRVCPADKAWVDIPTGPKTAHAMAECSNQGICNRGSGLCVCFPGFEGDACQRSSCPNGCSGHGRCVSLSAMAAETNAKPIGPATSYGGAESTTTWDEEKIFGCVCDSSWTVGFGASQRQETTWFGADCSLRHCPSGDDPNTDEDEENCFGWSGNRATWWGDTNSDGTPDLTSSPNSTHPELTAGEDYGATGNKCHVDCSNRGLCDYSSGLCRCFQGYYGENCARMDVRAKGEA